MSGRRLRALLAAAALGLVLAGCGSEGSGRGDGQWVGSAPTSAPTADLLSFTAPTIGGGEVDAATFRGRPTLLWFWAPW
jgi:hypothetical protein